MRKRHEHTNSAVERLRLAIDCLPVATREAMLAGVRSCERVMVGAYTDGRGGQCPMLAAHRRGARTEFLSFAKSWDRFTRARVPRPATAREVSILVSQLEGSLAASAGLELDRAIAEHHQLRGRSLRAASAARRLRQAADPAGEIVVRRLRRLRGKRQSGDKVAQPYAPRAASPVSPVG